MDEKELELIKAAAEKKAQEAVETAKGELNVDVQGKIDALKKDMESKIETAQTAEQVKSIVDETLKAINAQVEKLELALKEQGEKLQEKGKSTGKNFFEIFKEKYKSLRDGDKDTNPVNSFTIAEKDWNSQDTITVNNVSNTVYPENGTTGIIGTLAPYFAQVIGFFSKRKPKSRIMEYVDVIPLENNQLVAFVDDIIGEAEFVPECGLKPVIKPSLTAVVENAAKIAVFWKTSWEFRKYFNVVSSRFRTKAEELVNDAIPNAVIAKIKSAAAAFTPIPELAVDANPNNYDALGAVIAYLETLGYVPNVIFLNPVAWRNMKQLKSSTGEYILSNGNSISILDNGIDWGGEMIAVIKDPTLGYDEFIVGDMMAAVKVGIDAGLEYRENVNNEEDFQRNLLAHVLEKPVAIAIPLGANSGIISDTFSNVKTLITAEDVEP